MKKMSILIFFNFFLIINCTFSSSKMDSHVLRRHRNKYRFPSFYDAQLYWKVTIDIEWRITELAHETALLKVLFEKRFYMYKGRKRRSRKRDTRLVLPVCSLWIHSRNNETAVIYHLLTTLISLDFCRCISNRREKARILLTFSTL